ncbi:Pimeloyl-ACP methyl ester carboxylesterase [Devosia enhydra]|uniref:Pimeloyl-ACP methyl ester carboxylesterase n=1 Tax=Devosia enhydra TaxID=665118 RepID=A0A1K2HZG8_9HYPH|nr:alpha/beta hydrolase [Devosia enhydra]SFZ84550.1 Pimeloyl-ACP methyl ester carboxylesterase [Devosia enhydra]
MISRRALIGAAIAASGLVAASGGAAAAYHAAMAKAEALVSPGLSKVVRSRFGDLEYAEAGAGTPLLMVHGTGGGFDQGLFFTRRYWEGGYRVLAPSRFGYLRSNFPDDPSSENQADAFADLLDTLEIDRIAVAGGSAGALSAMAFAIRHPDRCAALIPLVPASHVPRDEPVQSVPPGQMQMAMEVLKSDFLFWLAIATVPDLLTEALLATSPALVRAANTGEQARARHILDSILPVSRRAKGLLNDALLAGNPAPMALKSITAPTLAISYEDDGFGTAAAARYIAEQVPGAQVHIFADGGHIGIGHDAECFMQVDRFLKQNGYV